MLRYYLRKSHLQGLTDKYFAQVEDVLTHDLQAVATMMAEQESLLNEDQAILCLSALEKVMKKAISAGEAMNLPFLKMHPVIKGVFDSPADGFSRNRHKVEMNLILGQALQELLLHVPVQKEEGESNTPLLEEVIDVASGSHNTGITANGMVKVEGARLKVAGDDPGNGIFFVAADGAETKVTAPLGENQPGKLIFTCPALTVGDRYTLKVVTQYMRSNVLLKTPRAGVFAAPLTVL
ncbi:MAG: DUF4469 domain-containing protein [Spirochaetota bacterium]